jgi:phospholipid/cholesterol/gamma-HCH transport system substrate-binding protein
MRRTPVLMAVAVIAATAAIVGFTVLSQSGRTPMTITAQFEDSVGLYVGNTVAVLGMPVGKVSGIAPKDSYVEVTLQIDRGVNIPADARAVTVSTSILTDRHVELTPAYRHGPKMRTGDVVGLTRTRTPVGFDRTLAMADRLSLALRGDGQGHGPMADLMTAAAQSTVGNGARIKSALDELSKALRLSADGGAGTKKDIQSIVSALSDLTQAAADNDTAIRQFGSNVHQMSDILSDQNLGAGTTGAQLNQILDQATSLLKANRDGLKSTVSDSQTLARAVGDMRRELAETMDLLPMLADNLYNAIDPNAGAVRVHTFIDKILVDNQMTKEVCNLLGRKDLGCATGTTRDYAPNFGVTTLVDGAAGMLELMAGVN